MTKTYLRELNAAKEAVAKAASLCSEAQVDLKSVGSLDKADKSPVTIADYGAQALVLDYLAKVFPNDPATGEEDASDLLKAENANILEQIVIRVGKVDPDLGQASIISAIERGAYPGGASGRFWTLDPIDGTKGFLRGDQYAIALGLIEDGEVVVGVLGCPNLPIDSSDPNSKHGCLLFASKGQGAFQCPIDDLASEIPIACDQISDPSEAVFCESVESGHTAHGRSAKILEALDSKSTPFRMDSQCKYAAVSRGQASIYLRLPTRPGYEEKIWDHAAGYLILKESGGRISDTFGEPLDFSLGQTLKKNKGVIATSAQVFEPVLQAVMSSQ
jgi:3'(2'), 5'-bisphosphate nucleotidase